jgi:amino acid adenylation domain-containing protein
MPFQPGEEDPIDWAYEAFPEEATRHSVHARFAAVAERYADHLAASDQNRRFTYGQIRRIAASISAAVLATERAGPVAIFLPNEARYPAAMLGIMAAGRGFVALDALHPAERSTEIAAHAQVAAVVSAGEFARQAQRLFPHAAVIDVETVPSAASAPTDASTPDDLAWIIYTSGSTGKPKGVYQNQRGLLVDAMFSVNDMHLGPRDRQFLYASPSLFAGTRIALTSLLSGGSLHCFTPDEIRSDNFAERLIDEGITIIRSVPALFRHTVKTLPAGGRLEGVRMVYLGGDRVDWSDYELFCRSCDETAVFGTHLGSTECSGVFLQWFTRKGLQHGTERLPVGRPVHAATVTLVGEDGQAVPDGEIGEYRVSCPHLAQGYWQEPGSAKFAVDADSGSRTFRTGDLGRKRPDGYFEHRGRADDQIKIAGYRIEPAEIEHALAACTGVHAGAVVIRRNESGAPVAVIAYVELKPGVRGLLPRHIRTALARQLPAHMLPATIHLLQALPILPNLKIDRQALYRVDAERSRHTDDRTSNPLLDQVAVVFEQTLEGAGATPDDNILSLGGDSFAAVTLGIALEQRFGLRLPNDVLAAAPTIREMATRIAAERRSAVA